MYIALNIFSFHRKQSSVWLSIFDVAKISLVQMLYIKYLSLLVLVLLSFSSISVFADNPIPTKIYIHDLSGHTGYSPWYCSKSYGECLKDKLESMTFSNGTKMFDEIVVHSSKQASDDNYTLLVTTGGIKANWIIYIGHGSSCTGQIGVDPEGSAKGKMIDPEELIGKNEWKDIKGVLLYGCAVIDIGDYGRQNAMAGSAKNNCKGEGNYCKAYFDVVNRSCPSKDFPDPGLKWYELAKANNIKRIAGFNYKAPTFNQGAGNVIGAFIIKWEEFNNKTFDDDNFIYAWAANKLTSDNSIERGYIRMSAGGTWYYSMGDNLGLHSGSPNKVMGKDEMDIGYYQQMRNYFVDYNADSNKWYVEFFDKSRKAGIVNNDLGAVDYRPIDKVSRSEFIKMLVKGKYFSQNKEFEIIGNDEKIKFNGEEIPCITSFQDVNNHWSKCFVKYAELNQWLEKKDYFSPDDKILRSDAVKLGVKSLSFCKDGVQCDCKNCKSPFPDVSIHDWSCPYIKYAKGKIMDGFKDGTFKPSDGLSRAEAVKIIWNAVNRPWEKSCD